MALSPALCLCLRVAGGGRRAPGGGRLSGCLFVYGHRSLYWFYTPASLKSKNVSREEGGNQPPGAQRASGVIYFSVSG